ncbi:MAG: hypothetical protein ACLR8Y_08655 [Alistipes indistinctus]
MAADTHSYPVPGACATASTKAFRGSTLQTGTASEFVAAPDWFYNFEYAEEAAPRLPRARRPADDRIFRDEYRQRPKRYLFLLHRRGRPGKFRHGFCRRIIAAVEQDRLPLLPAPFGAAIHRPARQPHRTGGRLPVVRTLGTRHVHRAAGRNAHTGRT